VNANAAAPRSISTKAIDDETMLPDAMVLPLLKRWPAWLHHDSISPNRDICWLSLEKKTGM